MNIDTEKDLKIGLKNSRECMLKMKETIDHAYSFYKYHAKLMRDIAPLDESKFMPSEISKEIIEHLLDSVNVSVAYLSVISTQQQAREVLVLMALLNRTIRGNSIENIIAKEDNKSLNLIDEAIVYIDDCIVPNNPNP